MVASALEERLRFTVLHTLAIKGMLVGSLAAKVTGLAERDVRSILDALAEGGLATFHASRAAWRISPAGKQHHRELLSADLDEEAKALIRPAYDSFLPVNTRFKALCTEWQVRSGAPNDHADGDYDARLIGSLGEVHIEVGELLDRMSAVRARFAGYGVRLSDALTRLLGGETAAFTGVLNDSYHEVWMELHRDLLLSLALNRSAEDG
ncbi:MAG: hypothetical protein ACRDTG_03580 [Pseudonocardiaceae bacterium]